MSNICSWSGDDTRVCKCHRCEKPTTVKVEASKVSLEDEMNEYKWAIDHRTALTEALLTVGSCNCHIGNKSTISEKLRFDLIPTIALEELALAYTIGARKYPLAPAVDTTTDDEEFAAIMRHLVAWRKGTMRDTEGHHHLAAVSARCFKLIARGA